MPWEAGKEPEDECILLYHKDDASINTDIRHITIDEYNNVYYMGRSLKVVLCFPLVIRVNSHHPSISAFCPLKEK